MSVALKEAEDLVRAQAELANAENAIRLATLKFEDEGSSQNAKAIIVARQNAELAQLQVERAQTRLAKAEAAATVAATEARRKRYEKGKPSIEAILTKETPLIEAESKLLLQLVDVRIARKNIRAEAQAAIQEWKPLYLEFEAPIVVSDDTLRHVTAGHWTLEQAMEWTDPATFRANPWLSFDVNPDPQPVIDGVRNMAKLINQPDRADPRGALLDRLLPAAIDYLLPSPPKVNGIYQEWLPTSEVPRFLDEKKGLLGGLLK